MSRRPILFYCPQMERVAKDVRRHAALLDCAVDLGEIKWSEYPDGWFDTQNLEVARGRMRDAHAFFLMSIDTPAELVRQAGALYAFHAYEAAMLDVFLPYFAPGTIEKIEVAGRIAYAKTAARMLSVTPPLRCGIPKFHIWDIHNEAEQFYFGDTVIYAPHTAIPRLIALVENTKLPITYVFPDLGAYDRFVKYKPHFVGRDLVLCEKRRMGSEREIRIIEGNPRDKHCVIVDDLIQSGRTLIACAHLLNQHGAKSISAFATHGVFPSGAIERIADSKLFTVVCVTDSVPRSALAMKQAGFTTLSLASDMARIIKESCL
ncbi:MAG: phosphoribosyltransferase family protein [bacterium]|nr:phosphoribosyltransferase family protein [bacterium]